MSEFMGLVRGQYDAKADGFLPGALGKLRCSATAPASLAVSPLPIEVPMGKLALFLGGFLLLTILVGLLGTIPPS